ncbi:hypothetical protein DYBT9275_02976 [Dyadobacter sp. CECT 9275]|uniref:Glycosyltransferase RgtA/B/C/D-like domain-containing protein n=1 Tax=Dyadobacter helix TaxID=2822344 RepID=A0A916N6B8_9BACT|nr:glycosyltransferase family 39 protein [Dyadobacter sp. CECT 9275]CAG5002836.1 hypothetical protein DYBT9275_02976 [Dyadobacter sp. CECT 9275]
MTQNKSKESLFTWIIFAIILTAGLFLRLHRLDTYSIFFDEKSTMVISQGIVLEGANQKEVFSTLKVTVPEFWKAPALDYRPPQVLRSFTYKETFIPRAFTPAEFWSPKSLADYYEAMNRSDIGNSPFYYLLLHYWMEIFGLSDYSARSLSVLFSVLIIGMTYLFARRFFSVKIGLIASAIVAIEPFFIAYSHQARNYSLTFFLTLLATYFFLLIVESKPGKTRAGLLYLGYILAAGLSLLSHFLVITVLMAHGLYALFFLRNLKTWVRLALAAPVALAGVTWWLMFGGGQYTLYTLSYQADLYRRMAETRPYDNPFGALPATFKNVYKKSLPLFSDLVLFTNGLAEVTQGKKNMLIAIFTGFLLILLYRYTERAQSRWLPGVHVTIKRLIPVALILLSLVVYNNHKIQFGILSVSIFALSFIPDIHRRADTMGRKRLWLLYIMALVPVLFLILMAIKNGHTFGIQQRYSGFSFPYVIIILSLLLVYYTKLRLEYAAMIYVFMAMQLYFVSLRLVEFYQDRSVKYGYFAEPRVSNPYYRAADQIKQIYQKGDTIYYPAPSMMILSEMDRTFLPYSIQDAQLTNLYLPKNADYVQVMDTTQAESILLKRKIQQDTLVIMRLKGLRYGSE